MSDLVLRFDVSDEPEGPVTQSLILACNRSGLAFRWEDKTMVITLDYAGQAFRLGMEHVFVLQELNAKIEAE